MLPPQRHSCEVALGALFRSQQQKAAINPPLACQGLHPIAVRLLGCSALLKITQPNIWHRREKEVNLWVTDVYAKSQYYCSAEGAVP